MVTGMIRTVRWCTESIALVWLCSHVCAATLTNAVGHCGASFSERHIYRAPTSGSRPWQNTGKCLPFLLISDSQTSLGRRHAAVVRYVHVAPPH
ncbi:hypothetical protein BKA93DRAFT_359429 [Sparassis latifolia]